ncbi:unnamed protein product, partial [Ixodes pacificus]
MSGFRIALLTSKPSSSATANNSTLSRLSKSISARYNVKVPFLSPFLFSLQHENYNTRRTRKSKSQSLTNRCRSAPVDPPSHRCHQLLRLAEQDSRPRREDDTEAGQTVALIQASLPTDENRRTTPAAARPTFIG